MMPRMKHKHSFHIKKQHKVQKFDQIERIFFLCAQLARSLVESETDEKSISSAKQQQQQKGAIC